MKTKARMLFLSLSMLVLAISAERSFAQDDLPWFMEQHGKNGDQSPQGAPLDGGTDILALLGVAYAAKKVSDLRKKNRISR